MGDNIAPEYVEKVTPIYWLFLHNIRDTSDNVYLFLQGTIPLQPGTLGVQLGPTPTTGFRGKHVSQAGH